LSHTATVRVSDPPGSPRSIPAGFQKPGQPMNDLQHTAIHEAGHAVIGRVLGMMCGGASIVADSKYAGDADIGSEIETARLWRWRYGVLLPRHYRKIMRGRILTYMAGAEAENVLVGQCPGGDQHDRREIDLMSKSDDADFALEQWERREPRLRVMAKMLVGRHRGNIERVAAQLTTRETLTADEIDALVRKR
jgi:hypothetical protein